MTTTVRKNATTYRKPSENIQSLYVAIRNLRQFFSRRNRRAHYVLYTLASYANADGTNISVGRAKLMEDTGYCKEALGHAIKELLDLHFLVRDGRGKYGHNRYRLNLPGHYLYSIQQPGDGHEEDIDMADIFEEDRRPPAMKKYIAEEKQSRPTHHAPPPASQPAQLTESLPSPQSYDEPPQLPQEGSQPVPDTEIEPLPQEEPDIITDEDICNRLASMLRIKHWIHSEKAPIAFILSSQPLKLNKQEVAFLWETRVSLEQAMGIYGHGLEHWLLQQEEEKSTVDLGI